MIQKVYGESIEGFIYFLHESPYISITNNVYSMFIGFVIEIMAMRSFGESIYAQVKFRYPRKISI